MANVSSSAKSLCFLITIIQMFSCHHVVNSLPSQVESSRCLIVETSHCRDVASLSDDRMANVSSSAESLCFLITIGQWEDGQCVKQCRVSLFSHYHHIAAYIIVLSLRRLMVETSPKLLQSICIPTHIYPIYLYYTHKVQAFSPKVLQSICIPTPLHPIYLYYVSPLTNEYPLPFTQHPLPFPNTLFPLPNTLHL
jgi:hypothetical protein